MTKYLHKFNTEVAFDAAYNGEDYHEPWVSLVAENGQVNYNKGIGYVDYVDLGLPSGTLWATQNLGATSENPAGDRYAGGELEVKEACNRANYRFATEPYNSSYGNGHDWSKYNFADEKMTLDDEDDVVVQTIGNGGHIPNHNQIKELAQNCFAVEVNEGENYIKLKSYINEKTITFYGDVWSNEICYPLNGVSTKEFAHLLDFDFSYGGGIDTSTPDARGADNFIRPVKDNLD